MINKLYKLIKNPGLLLFKLDNKNIIRLKDEMYLKIQYRLKFNKKLDLKKPKTFNEKLQWLKLNDRNPDYIKMVDKFEAKKYVAGLIGDEYIIPTLGVWDSFDDINFDTLPNRFVLKCTHDSGGLVICKDKSSFNYEDARKKLTNWLNINFYYSSREWPYKNIKPRIIAEEYMEDEKSAELVDYKFFCFNGCPKFIYVSEGLSNHSTAKMDFLDMNYEKVPFKREDYKNFEKLPLRPVNFEKMKELAINLSKNITFIRVDFYEINGKLYFGELTFFPCAGFIKFSPEEWDRKLGDMLILSEEKSVNNEK